MARRRIGQEDLIARPEPRTAASSLAELAGLLDRGKIDRALAGGSAAAKGEPGWPPLALFRGLLLAPWHDLSDIRLAEALDDRASFRRFCTFAAHEPTPERTSFVRFRRELVAGGVGERCGRSKLRLDPANSPPWKPSPPSHSPSLLAFKRRRSMTSRTKPASKSWDAW